jgi:hypothetical protein
MNFFLGGFESVLAVMTKDRSGSNHIRFEFTKKLYIKKFTTTQLMFVAKNSQATRYHCIQVFFCVLCLCCGKKKKKKKKGSARNTGNCQMSNSSVKKVFILNKMWNYNYLNDIN